VDDDTYVVRLEVGVDVGVDEGAFLVEFVRRYDDTDVGELVGVLVSHGGKEELGHDVGFYKGCDVESESTAMKDTDVEGVPVVRSWAWALR
jgi:hypothetical protein